MSELELYNLTQTGDEVQDYIDSIPVIDITGTQSGNTIAFGSNPYSAIDANNIAGCGSIIRLTVDSDIYLLPVTKKNSSTYTASVMIGAHNIVATITSSAASATIDSGIDDTPTADSDNLITSGAVAEVEELIQGSTTTVDSSQTTARSSYTQYFPIGRTLSSGTTYRIRLTFSGYRSSGTGTTIMSCKGSASTSGGGVDNLLTLMGDDKFNKTYEFNYTPTVNAKYIYVSHASGYSALGTEEVTIETLTTTSYDYITELRTASASHETSIDALDNAVFGNGRRLIASTDTKGGAGNTYAPMGAVLESGRTYRITLTTEGWASATLSKIQSATTNSGTGIVEDMSFASKATNKTQTIDYTPSTTNICMIYMTPPSTYIATGNEKVKIQVEEYIADDTTKGQAFVAEDATLAGDSTLYLPMVFARKNSIMSVALGSFTSIRFGNTGSYFSSVYLDIDATNIKVYRYLNSWSLETTLTHGLTIGTRNVVSIAQNDSGTMTITMFCDGVKYTTTLNYTTGGSPAVKNTGSANINVRLSYSPLDIDKEVWIVGDSYLSYDDSARWLYYPINDNKVGFLANNLSGGNYRTLMRSFRNVLRLGAPKVVIWCSGMNDGSDTSGAPNQIWLGFVQGFLTLAQTFGFTPILYCTPTVPSVANEQKCAWVRASGYRYLDASLAVGAQSDGTWLSGMLSNDNLHPTQKGARAIYAQALTDIPELMKK